MKRFTKFFSLKKHERKLLLQTYITLTTIRLGLLILPFSRLQLFLKKFVRFNKVAIETERQVLPLDIARATHRSSKLCLGTVKCLAKALTVNILMSKYNYPCKLNIGVTKGKSNALEAHAWVEAEGKVIVGYLPDLSSFQIMYSPEGSLLL